MDLIKYEFYKEEDGAYYHFIGQLVQRVRYYRENVPVDEFKAAIPELKELESTLQDIDSNLGHETRYYLQEIMEELNAESEVQEKVIDEIERSAKAIVNSIYDTNLAMEDFSYAFRKSESYFWLEFFGYKEGNKFDGALLVIKEVFRAVCYKYNIIFIDISLTGQ